MESDDEYNLEYFDDNNDIIYGKEEVGEGIEEESDEEFDNMATATSQINDCRIRKVRGYKYPRNLPKKETDATHDQDTDPGSEPIPSGRAGNTDCCLLACVAIARPCRRILNPYAEGSRPTDPYIQGPEKAASTAIGRRSLRVRALCPNRQRSKTSKYNCMSIEQ